MIPFHISSVGRDEVEAARRAILNNCLSGNGPIGKRLEEAFKIYTKAEYALFTNSCTSAIEMALMVLGVTKGDEVILPSFSFVSVAGAVVKTGARLIFVDIDEDTLNMDPLLVKKAITKRTKVIMPVHYAGNSCPMDEISAVSKRSGIRIIEDAAQAIGSFYKNRHLGTIGDIGCLSLHGTKNITCGEGGIFLTNNGRMAASADIVREKGTNRSAFLKGKINKYAWISLGSSYVQSDILAAIALEQLKKIDLIKKRRTENAIFLNSRLAGFRPFIKIPRTTEGAKPNYHIYPVVLQKKVFRDRFIGLLRREGVECSTHFVPLSVSPFARKYLGYKRGDFPVTEKVCDSLVRLPIHPQLDRKDLQHIVHAVEKAVRDMG